MPKKPAKKPETVPEREVRDDRLSFRCPAVLRQGIEHFAAKDKRSVSDWIVLQLDRVVRELDWDKE